MAVREQKVDEPVLFNAEGGGMEQAASGTSTQYGAAQNRGSSRLAPSRAWALGAVLLSCAVVGALQVIRSSTAPTELAVRAKAGGQSLKATLDSQPDQYTLKKISFTRGESHMINDVFSQDSSKDELEDKVYELVRPELLEELQDEIVKEMDEEVQNAVKKLQQEHYLHATGTIQSEMGAVMQDVDKQKVINSKFHAMVSRAKELEHEICKGEPCQNWDELLAGATKKESALRKALAMAKKDRAADEAMYSSSDKDMSALIDSQEEKAGSMEQDVTYWHGLANVYYAMLHPRTTPMPLQTPPPPPPHCSGLKTIYGATGSISTGPAGTATDLANNDCRWIIKSPNAEIVLRFPNLKVLGSEGRVSIFVGPENVALYKNEDVVNWASAYKSFTGSAYPAPVVCPSNEVLVIFHTAESDAMKSEFDMTWVSGVEASAKALIADALASSRGHQQLAQIKLTDAKQSRYG